MFRRIYYLAKPFTPWHLRISVRRFFARRKRARTTEIWPISKTSAQKPKGWPGWPEGKQFGFALSHDVEGQLGVDRVKQLAELEMEFGFRSSFNFIPEGEYSVPKELRGWLTENGFEVGVHDLHHDGKLFDSRKIFARKAVKINQYLSKWDAVGYRSGFMLHNLNWFHDLNILYDASTFDTDPFEPQPDEADTIFPFWVPKIDEDSAEARLPIKDMEKRVGSGVKPNNDKSASKEGYLELPYTLPQDSTMFLLFREKDCQIWKDKTKWIAENGGMCLLNLHPDYVRFEGKPTAREFPAENYKDFLGFVRDHFEHEYCHLLPREIAETYSVRNGGS